MSICVAIGPSSFAESNPFPRQLLEDAGVTVRANPFNRRMTEAEIIEQLQGVDGLIAGLEPLNRKVIAAAAPRLRAIARVGIGTSNVDFGAAEEFGVKVSSTPDAPAEAVAEMTLCALLTIARKIIPLNSRLHARQWEKLIGFSLSGATVLVVGYGRIGARVAMLLNSFGSRVLVCDPLARPDTLEPGMTLCTLEEALPQADVITLHANSEQPLLDRPQFEVMKKGVILLNSARGELVVQSALVVALEEGKVGAGWFDAFWEEPYSGVLCNYEQVLLTPHISTYTHECRLAMETQAVQNLLRDLGIAAPALIGG